MTRPPTSGPHADLYLRMGTSGRGVSRQAGGAARAGRRGPGARLLHKHNSCRRAQPGRLPGRGTQGLWSDAAAPSLCNNCWAACPHRQALPAVVREGPLLNPCPEPGLGPPWGAAAVAPSPVWGRAQAYAQHRTARWGPPPAAPAQHKGLGWAPCPKAPPLPRI